MEKFELEQELADEIRDRVCGAGFMKLVQSARRGGRSLKVSLRPVDIGGTVKFQIETVDDGRVKVRNAEKCDIDRELAGILAQKGARDIHVMSASGDLHVRVTKKGRALVSRSAETNREVSVLPHDRVKKVPLTSFDSSALLRAIGITDGSGAVKASMRGKYDQVNEFLRIVGEVLGKDAVKPRDRPFTVVDCGCGKAYLTIALYHYLVHSLGMQDVRVVGIDRRADVISSARKAAEALGVADNVEFVEADLTDFKPREGDFRADMVVSLHACDTATDEAMARGVEWKSKYVLAAPCCQHELQKSLASGRALSAFSALVRQPILRERMCDLLTDAFRASIMRILGYRVSVVEFVSGEATMRNVMIKCEYGTKPGRSDAVGEYLSLRDFWNVTPWLESRLAPLLERYVK